MTVHRMYERDGRGLLAPTGRAATLSAGIVEAVRDALFDGRLKPGDFLGTEKDLAAAHDVSRVVARDALRTLEASGVVEIRVGARGGARIAQGNAARYAEALAVQLKLAGVSVTEIMDAQRVVETAAAEMAARNRTEDDLAALRALLDEAEEVFDDVDAYTRSSMQFHLGIAEASHNRVLVVQLVSLHHVAWPTRNRTLTTDVARHILDVHRELYGLIEARDAEAARTLMHDHVGLIRARRRAESGEDGTAGEAAGTDDDICC